MTAKRNDERTTEHTTINVNRDMINTSNKLLDNDSVKALGRPMRFFLQTTTFSGVC